MIWWQVVIVAWGTTSVMLFGVLSACFRAATGYDSWMHANVARASGEALLDEAA
jgi:hypothetical protein